MKTGLTMTYLNRYGMREGAKMMKAHGYDCVDYQRIAETNDELYSYPTEKLKSYLTDVKNLLNDEGITVSQTHGPWRYPPQDFTEEDRAERFEKMSKAIYMTKLLGTRNFVIHNIMPFGVEDSDYDAAVEINREYFSRLLKVAKDNDVIICLENMPFDKQALAHPQKTLEFVKSFNDANFRMCLDTGHAIILGAKPGEAVRMIGKEYLCALHVHDNDGAHDQHFLPYNGVIDWLDFSSALKEIGFDGVFSLETSVHGEISPETEQKEKELATLTNKLAGNI